MCPSFLILLLLLFHGISSDEGPKVEALTKSKVTSSSTTSDNLPIFPERSDAAYFVVAVSGGIKMWGRSLARTLLDMGDVFSSPHGPPLRPIYIDLPLNGRWVKISSNKFPRIYSNLIRDFYLSTDFHLSSHLLLSDLWINLS